LAAGPRFLVDLVRQLKIPSLSRCGLQPGDVSGMVALARKASSMRYNPVVLSDETLAQVLSTAAEF
jgi:alcohol dehydrogenase class IV